LKFTEHSRLAMHDDDLEVDDVIYAINQDEIIERYPNSKPFQSCLLYGRTRDEKPVHIVCALPSHVDMLIIVTAYLPNQEDWIEFRRRRKK